MQNAMEKIQKGQNALIMKSKLAYRRIKWHSHIYTEIIMFTKSMVSILGLHDVTHIMLLRPIP